MGRNEIEIENEKFDDSFKNFTIVNKNLFEDNFKYDDSYKNFTIVNNSSSFNITEYPKYKDYRSSDDSSANKVTKISIVLNLILLFNIFLNM